MNSAHLQIIGVGSPLGDDRLGWVVIERLQQRLPNDTACKLVALDRPGPGLIDYLLSGDECWLVDALWSEEQPGRYLQPGLEQLQQTTAAAASHGFGLAETLRLAGALGALPERLELHCLTINSADVVSEQLSPAVDAGVDRLVQRLYQRLVENVDHSAGNL